MEITLPRADRIALGIPILYHRSGDDHWFQARVVNLSESGVLFGPSELEPGTPVEVIISPPIQVGTLASGKQLCAAEVVRATEMHAVAVRFDECRFLLDA
jgi:PilZ domain-containing protein